MLARSHSADEKTEFTRTQERGLSQKPPWVPPLRVLHCIQVQTYRRPQSSHLRRCPLRPSRTWSLTQSALWHRSGTSGGKTYSIPAPQKAGGEFRKDLVLSAPPSLPPSSPPPFPPCPLPLSLPSLPSFESMCLTATNISQSLGGRVFSFAIETNASCLFF